MSIRSGLLNSNTQNHPHNKENNLSRNVLKK